MVAMDPDTEFNTLATLYQSVVADMKASYPAWETVGQRAVKLAAALKTTLAALAAFSDAVQHVSDLASNLKGASRDVGACVTRICMRQRALEGRMKSLSDALSDELAVGVHARTAYWRGRTAEMDKTAGKHVKKVRSRKQRPDEAAVCTQRGLCKQLLAEQRAQFGFFLSQLQPVLTAEVSLLDEASHIRPSVESLETTMKAVDGEQLVEGILMDLTEGASSAWQKLSTAGLSSAPPSIGGSQLVCPSFSLSSSTTTTSSEGVGGEEGGSSRMTSPSAMGAYEDTYALPSTAAMLDTELTPQLQQLQHGYQQRMQHVTAPAAVAAGLHHHGQPIQNIYASLPMASSTHSQQQMQQSHMLHSQSTAAAATPTTAGPRPVLPPTVPINGAMGMHRSTLGRRLSSTSVPAVPATPTSMLSASPTEHSTVSSFRGSSSELRPGSISRPQSFVGGSQQLQHGGVVMQHAASTAPAAAGNYAMTPLLTPAGTIGGGGYGASTSFSYGGSSSSSSSVSAAGTTAAAAAAHDEAATSSMIAETVQAIEGLGSDLDQFCTPRADGTGGTMRRGDYEVYMRHHNNNNNNHNSMNGGPVRVRPDSTARPPPPSRRSSAITSATPSAPSIADARMSIVSGQSGSLRASRQSLNSLGVGDSAASAAAEAPPTPLGPAPYNLIDTTPVSFRQSQQYAGYGRPY